jgi:Beta-galactosidase
MNIYNTIIKSVLLTTTLLTTALHAQAYKEVRLTTAKNFPIVIENKVSGSVTVPKGTILKVISINNNKIVVDFGGSNQTVGVEETDYTNGIANNLAASNSISPYEAASVSATSYSKSNNNCGVNSKSIDKTLNESSLSHFFIPCDEHSPSLIDGERIQYPTPLKDEWVTVKDGHLYSGGKRLRIMGVNIATEMKHTGYKFNSSDILEMKKYGFNGVRIWVQHSIFNTKTHTLSPSEWGIFDKEIADFIKSGMWIELNLLKLVVGSEVDPKIDKLDKAFLKEFFAHINPYTGRSYANEPAIFCVELGNEDGINGEGYLHSDVADRFFINFETYKTELHTLWNEWLLKKYADQTALNKAWKNNKENLGAIASLDRKNWTQFPPEKEEDWRRFLTSLEVNWYKSTIDYIHKDLRYRGLVSASAEISAPPVIANLGDIVRNQGYDRDPTHPEAQKRPELIGVDQSLDTSGVWRVAGKPFIQTEHNIFEPSPYSGETVLFAFTAAAVQDWDGIFLFHWDFPWSKENDFYAEREGGGGGGIGYIINNPLLLASMPTAANIFLRGDLKPATSSKFERFKSDDLLTNGTSKAVYGSANPCDLFHTRLGTAFSALNASEELFGDGGTCHADSDYNIEVNSPKTVMTITSKVTEKRTIGGYTLEVGKTLLNWVCFGVTSLNNDLPIKNANKILVTLIGSNGDPRKLIPWQKEWPKGPCMVECISANVFIPVDTSKGSFKAYSLDEKAQRKESIPLEVTPEGITLHTTGKEGTVWYLIEKN